MPAETVLFEGLDEATPGPGVIDAITDADLVVLPPSNPVVSVGTILGVPRVREALAATRAPVVGLSPIVGTSHVRGMAEQMLTSIGVRGQRRRGRARTTAPGRPAASSTAGSSTSATPSSWAWLHEAGLAAAAVPR